MNKEDLTSYREAYTNFSNRIENYFAKQFWWFVAFFATFLVLCNLVGLPWLVSTLSGLIILNTSLMLWFLGKNLFESMREMKAVFLVYAILNAALCFCLLLEVFNALY